MKTTLKTFALLAALGTGAHACAAGAITAQNAWVRWLPNQLPAGGYVTLVNTGDKPVDLVDIDSPDYGMAMLHQTVSNGSTQKMEMVDKLTIPRAARSTSRRAAITSCSRNRSTRSSPATPCACG